MTYRHLKALFVMFVLIGDAAIAQQPASLSGTALVNALRQGGYVLVMRHATAPSALPDAAAARPGNEKRERQLSDAGMKAAVEMGQAIRALGIPVGRVLTSPTFRTRETAAAMAVGPVEVREALSEGSASMLDRAAVTARALTALAAERPAGKTNTILITHGGNVSGAFPGSTPAPVEGEAFVARPDGKGGVVLVARVRIEEWPALAGR